MVEVRVRVGKNRGLGENLGWEELELKIGSGLLGLRRELGLGIVGVKIEVRESWGWNWGWGEMRRVRVEPQHSPPLTLIPTLTLSFIPTLTHTIT